MDRVAVHFVNNDTGTADVKSLSAGTTLAQFLAQMGVNAGNYSVRVNRENQTNSYVLKNNDTVALTPGKVVGA